MAKPKKRFKNLLGTLKDKISIVKATLLITATRTASIQRTVIHATSHSTCKTPPPITDDDIYTLSHHRRFTTGALVYALHRRVHHTSDAYVALSCLLTFHNLISHGPHLVNDNIDIVEGPLFNLSGFRDRSNVNTWELSNWIRWYAKVLDQRVSLPFKKSFHLLIEILENLSECPYSKEYHKINLVYEIMKLIGEEYRLLIREMYTKVKEFSTKIEDFTDESLDKLLGDLRRIENCKEKLLLMFLNKIKYDGFWELIEKVRKDVEGEKMKRNLSTTCGGIWLDADWNW